MPPRSGATARSPALPAIAGARNPSLELRAQVGFLHKAILATVNGPELLFRRDLEVLCLEVAKAHHTAEESVAIGAVIRVQAVDAGFDEVSFWRRPLDTEVFILKPAARTGASESPPVILQDDPKPLTVNPAVWGRVAKHEFDGQNAGQHSATDMNRHWNPA